MSHVKKNCQEKISKINDYLSSFISDKPPLKISNERQTTVSKTHPSNRSDFESRLATFEYGTWLIAEISPLQCAQRGWTYQDTNMLHCATCEAFLCTTLPSLLEREAYSHAINILRLKLKDHHKIWCGWRENESPIEFTKPPFTLSVHYLNQLKHHTENLLSLKNSLPYFSSQQMIIKLGIEADDLKTIVKSKNLEETELISCMLSLCGWRMTNANHIRCNLCLRSIGLWNFYSLEEKEKYEEVEEQKLVVKEKRRMRAIKIQENKQAAEQKKARLIAQEQIRIEAALALGEDRLLEGDVADPVSDVDEEELMLQPEADKNGTDVTEPEGNESNEPLTVSTLTGPTFDQQILTSGVPESAQMGIIDDLSNSAVDVDQPGNSSSDSSLRKREPTPIEMTGATNSTDCDETAPDANGHNSTMEADPSISCDAAPKVNDSNNTEVSMLEQESSDNNSCKISSNGKRRRTSDETLEECGNKRACPEPDDGSEISNGSNIPEDEITDVEHSKQLFDPIIEHRFWCGWIASIGREYSPNVKGFMVIPPQLKAFQFEMEEQNLIASEKYAKNVEGLRAVRMILESSIHED